MCLLTLLKNVSLFAQSNFTEERIQFCVILSACQCQFDRKKCHFELFGFFAKSFLILGKMLESPWRSECSWRLIFEPPKIAKVELWFERELNFGNFRWHIFLLFSENYLKNMKFELSFERELNFCGPVA